MTGARGFTLLEILVALAIFAVASVTVYGRVGDMLMQSRSLENRTFATWIAQNSLARLQLAQVPGEAPATGHQVEAASMAGRDWEIVIDSTSTAEAGLRRVEIQVHLLDPSTRTRPADPVATLTGFLGQH